MKKILTLCALTAALAACSPKQQQQEYYGALQEAPVSAIRAEGWLRGLLEAQRDGLGIHRAESGYPYNTCMWAGEIPKGGNPIAKDWWPYEQSGYMVDGLYRAGILLGDEGLLQLGRSNVEYAITHPRPNGRMGPAGMGDLQWAFTVFARTLSAGYDDTADPRILEALARHFAALPDSLVNRQACIVESMCKYYSLTGDKAILAHADTIWRRFSVDPCPPENINFRHTHMVAADTVTVHGVTAAEVSKQAAILYLYTGNRDYLDAALGFYAAVERDHELVDGIPTSCERLFGKAPEALHETCDVSDFTWSYGYLLMATGDVKWADKIERAFYNAALGSISKDFCAHQYFSSPNQVVATQYSSTADYGQEGLIRQSYRPGHDVECCSGNVHRMIPAFASRMWMRTPEGGIAAALFAPGSFSTTVDGVPVTVEARTDYPFGGEVAFVFEADKPVKFPFLVRIPAWAEGSTLAVNDETAQHVEAGTFHTVTRKFRAGDVVTLRMPMQPRMEYTCDGTAANILRGPLLFSVDIAENAVKVTGQLKTSEAFPAWDITPASPWNYAVAAGEPIEVVTAPVGENPWTPATSPVRLKLKAWRVPGWTVGQTTPLLPAPGFTTGLEAEPIEMVPSGATRIRLTTLPVKK